MHPLSVDGDLLLRGIDAGAKVAHRLSIDTHVAAADQFVALSPRADASVGQVFIEAFHESLLPPDDPRSGKDPRARGCSDDTIAEATAGRQGRSRTRAGRPALARRLSRGRLLELGHEGSVPRIG